MLLNTDSEVKTIICMKWGTRYGAHYVNTLAAMVSRNLTLPYRFLCFTDDAGGLDSSIIVRPLPAMNLPEHYPERGWRKLTLFGHELDDLHGTALFLDLDLVIRDSIDSFFEWSGDFLIIKDWDFPDSVIGNSSVFRFELGTHHDILDRFVGEREKVVAQHRNEQAYLSHAVATKGLLSYWPASWCVSFKRHCIRPFPLGYCFPPREPTDAKIVVFHGKPNPDQVIQGWIGKYGFRAVRPTPWVDNLWRK